MDDDKVFEWRKAELERAGYTLEQAVVLAASRTVDLHYACDLLRHGADPAVAFDICSEEPV